MATTPDAPHSDPGSFPQHVREDAPTQPRETLLFRRYRVLRELGRGGMGVVLLAHDIALDVPVAIKLVPDLVAKDTEAIVDLRKEVLRGMALAHPAVVRTHQFERDDSGAAIVMEYVEGETLAEFKARQPGGCCDPEAILPWLPQLTVVLDYAHGEARLVHRDLKPRNIMLTRAGRVKVADFGIAAVISDSMTRHSMDGKVSGTLGYMSPQQAQGLRPTPLDDIYSLGATLYELLTGKPPFFRGGPAAIMAQITSVTPPSVTERRNELEVLDKAALPPGWEEVLAACLAKDPRERPATAGEILVRLRQAVPPPMPEPPTQSASVPPTARTSAPISVPAPAAPRPPIGSPVPPLHPAPAPVAAAPPPQKGGRGWAIAGLAAVLAAAVGAGAYFGGKDAPSTTGAALQTPAPAPSAVATPAPAVVTAAPPPISVAAPVATPAPAAATPAPATPAPVQVLATRDRPYVNNLGMRFVPAGTRDVLMSVWETRVQDYARYVEATGVGDESGVFVMNVAKNSKTGGYSLEMIWNAKATWQNPGFAQGDSHPIAGRSLDSARAFCGWLTELERKDGRLPAGAFYALPTDEEWSTAAGVATYPWGDQFPPPKTAGNYFDSAAIARLPGKGWTNILSFNDHAAFTAPVGSYEPNLYGLYDLGGNLSEWTESLYDPTLNSRAFLEANKGMKIGFATDGDPYSTVRGASWWTAQKLWVETGMREKESPAWGQARIGFRCVLILAPQTAGDFRRRASFHTAKGKAAEAADDYTRVLELDASDYVGLNWRAAGHVRALRYREALADREALYRHHGRFPITANNLAWFLATCPDDSVREGQRAVTLALDACKATDNKSAMILDTLAAAYAEIGNWAKAVEKQKAAIALIDKSQTESLADHRSRLSLYEARLPYREKPGE